MGRSVEEMIAFMADPGAANASDDAQVFELLSSWSRHVISWVGAERRLLVRYEDLVAEPVRYFGRIIRFLGTGEVDQKRLETTIAFSSFKELAAQEAADGYTAGGRHEKFFRRGKAGGWRDALSADQAARIFAQHGEVMGKLGYTENEQD